MPTSSTLHDPTTEETPLSTFSRCHLGIISQLEAAAALPRLLESAQRARDTAQRTLELFRHSVLHHHQEEEQELFTAVLQSARPEEKAQVQALVDQLTADHRAIEALWKRLEPAVRHAARGAPAELDAGLLADLVQLYLQHARREETSFLPLAERILGRDGNHMAALGLSLHLRQAPQVIGYI